MDISTYPLLQLPIRGLDWFNERHPFSHNDYFHDWILRNLPAGRSRALDVGCGEGLLARKLAAHFGQVDAADRSPVMRRAVDALGEPHVRVLDDFDAAEGPYDLITMVSALHHLDLEPALQRAAHLLAPGGRLSVVGMAAPQSIADAVWVAASAAATPLIGVLTHPRPASGPRPPDPYPVMEPQCTVDDVRAAAHAILPGSAVRRAVPFRYTLAWTAPDTH